MIAISVMSPFQCVENDDLLAAYSELSRTEYSWEELQERPLPPGVDPAKIETYLADSVFMVSLGLHQDFPSGCRDSQMQVSYAINSELKAPKAP